MLFGHSSGGASRRRVLLPGFRTSEGALLVSGIYDLLPVRLSARNEYVRLDERLEHEYSPIRHVERDPLPGDGGLGGEGERRSSTASREAFAEQLGAPALVGKGLNHFEIVETLADPRSPLGRAALNMLQ